MLNVEKKNKPPKIFYWQNKYSSKYKLQQTTEELGITTFLGLQTDRT